LAKVLVLVDIQCIAISFDVWLRFISIAAVSVLAQRTILCVT